ncbi:gastrula zinc finger protein XlCGF57.1-like [Corythoichthys intestinalis]|uniref:gastrula zinc finger protein XlCGF57.1-like n=1 Tax=Corythoichthys intestinalis TaxID=161448 RepID=UPI0025A4DB3E|nr:gastrula zinc finger protein XlCGF57.1-like [Corythoichthys intestinalis]
MVQNCCAMWCTNSYLSKYSIHEFPSAKKKDGLRRQWVKFVRAKRANFPDPASGTVLCGAHFQPESFSNYGQVKLGFAKRLLLKADAVPTIHAQPPKCPKARRKKKKTPTDETTSPSQATQTRVVAKLELARCPTDVTTEDLHPKKHDPLHFKQEWEMPYIKQESEPVIPYIKEEEQEEELPKCTVTFHVKSEENEGPSEEGEAAKPSIDSSFLHPTTKEEERSQPDSLLAPLSDSDDVTSHSSDFNTDDDEDQNAWKSLNKSSLKRSAKECTGGKPFACTLYDKGFSRKTDLEMHKRTHTGEKPFVCTCCGKRFGQKGNLIQHTGTHSGEKPYACTFCNKGFSRKTHLELHKRTHTGEKPFVCTSCGKRFNDKANLNRHAKTHSGEKPFACTFCNKRFSMKTNREKHMRTHTGEKPFVCTSCGKRFNDKGNLNRHAKKHSGEKKPFGCTFCNKGFSRKSRLEMHKRTHTGEKPFVCTWCGKTFSDKGNLNQHTRTHSGEKLFTCSVCRKRFRQKGALSRHARTHIGEKSF